MDLLSLCALSTQFPLYSGPQCVPSCVAVVYARTPLVFPQLFPESRNWGVFARYHPHCLPESVTQNSCSILWRPGIGGRQMKRVTVCEIGPRSLSSAHTNCSVHGDRCLSSPSFHFLDNFPQSSVYSLPTVIFLTCQFSNYFSEWEQSVPWLKLNDGHSSLNSPSKQGTMTRIFQL